MCNLAEKSVIGSLLLDQNSINKIYGELKADMFADPILGAIYVEYLRAFDNGYSLTIASLKQRLAGDQIPEDILLRTLKNCAVSVVTSAEIKTHAKVIVNEYKAVSFGKILGFAKAKAYDIDRQIGETINELEALLSGQKNEAKALKDVVKANKGRYFTESKTTKLYTGLNRVDDLTDGLEGGDTIVIAARPGVGKSALVTQIALNLAENKKRVGFYNLEMREKQIYERFLSNKTQLSLTRIRRAKQFLGDEKDRFDAANEYLSDMDIMISSGSKTVGEIRTESRHMGYDIIIIDYLQLLKSDIRYQNRTSEVGAISRAIKALAMELNIPIIALSQLNRASEARDTKEPTMAELREAGDIEQDASIIMMVWNMDDKDRSKKGFKVEKNRQGTTGKVSLKFNGDLMRFEETGEDVDKFVKAEEKTPFD